MKETCQSLPSVGIIVLNWNGYQDTKRCLQSLGDINYSNYRVYVVDNGSSDESGKRIANEFDWCHILQSQRNRGFAGGNNIGIHRALSDNMDYILLVNNDVEVEEDFLTPLVNTSENHRNVGIVGGVILHSNKEEIWYAGSSFNPAFVRTQHKTYIDSLRPFNTEHVTGALMLLSAEFLQEEGVLNEKYFFGFEDAELSWRARQNGWKVMVNPNSHIEHAVSSSAGSRSPFKYYHATRNRLQFAESHLSLLQRTLFYGFFGAGRLFRTIQWLPNKRDLIKAVADGILDHVLERPHKRPEEFSGSPDT